MTDRLVSLDHLDALNRPKQDGAQDVVTDEKMRAQDWGWARLVSITPTADGRVKIMVEYDTDPHQLADIAALMLRHAANEVRRPGSRNRRARSPGD